MATKKKKKAEMPKEECCPVTGFTNQTVIFGIVMLIVGLIVGSMLTPLVYNGQMVVPGVGAEDFELDEEKASKITTVMEKLALVSLGQETTLVLESVEEKTVLRFVFNYEGQETTIYVNEDYSEILGTESIQNVEEFETLLDELIEAYGLSYSGNGGDNGVDAQTKAEVPVVKLFVMSDCPAGNAAENNIQSVVQLLGDKIEFEPVYILSDYDGDGIYNSLHGTYELNQDVREKIVYNMYGAETWVEYVVGVNSACDSDNMEECWAAVAEDMELDVEAIETAFVEQFDEITSSEASMTSEYGVGASPTIVINGEKTKGAKDGGTYLSMICGGFLEAPEECDEEVTGNSQASGSCG